MKAAVIILNFNGKHFLEKFLQNVLDNTSEKSEVIVVDNASTDDSVAFLKTAFPAVQCLVTPENYGYAGGYNYALERIKDPISILLNSDIEVSKNWDIPLLDLLQSDSTIAACQPKIVDFKDKTMFEYAGAAGGFIDMDYYPICRGRIMGKVEKDEGQYNDTCEIFWATGAAFAVRRAVFIEAGGFDADFFAHMEEIDLCCRIKQLGHKIYYQGKSTIYHVGGGTLDATSPFKLYLNFRNNLFLILKNHSRNWVFGKLFRRMVLDGVSAASYIVKLQPKNFMAVLKAHMHFYKGFSKMWEKRIAIQTKTVNPNWYGVIKQSLIVRYYFFGVRKFKGFKLK